ncbi:hypothetical protein C8R43DRAFT_961419 [Mycena crocata]|nr:hypothetical protein C8R43DRAFT_961419 [Mycena crocata]
MDSATPRCEGPPPPVYDGPVTPKELEEKMLIHTACLQQYDLYLGLDNSVSMWSDCAGFTRWERLKHVVKQIAAHSFRVNTDGIDIFFVDKAEVQTEKCKTVKEVEQIIKDIEPADETPLGMTVWNHLKTYLATLKRYALRKQEIEQRITGLKAAKLILKENKNSFDMDARRINELPELRKHLKKEERRLKKHSRARPKPRNYIFVTDGVVDDKALLVHTILHVQEFLKNNGLASIDCMTCEPNNNGVAKTHRQLGLQFIQIGNDRAGRAFLQELDNMKGRDENNEPLPDIVDTTKAAGDGTLAPDNLVKALLGGIKSDFDNRLDVSGNFHEGPENEFITGDHWPWHKRFRYTHPRCQIGTRATGPGCWYRDDLDGAWMRNPSCL